MVPFRRLMVAIIWLYMSGEIVNPEKTIPKKFIHRVGYLYHGVFVDQCSYVYVLPLISMAQSSLVASDAAQAAFEQWAED
jgi:hypothetical protein